MGTGRGRIVFLAGVTLLAASVGSTQAWADEMTDFSSGLEGWAGPQGPGGSSFIDNAQGHPAPSYRTQFNNFGITYANSTNAGFVGDYTLAPTATILIDVRTILVNFFGQNVSRDWVVELRDYDNPPAGYPWVSVWYDMGNIAGSANPAWLPYSVTIADTSSLSLPPGWGGYGAEDPNTFEPELPPNRTFKSVLEGVDELAFTTLTPGFLFGFTDFDVAVDNISLTFVPEPVSLAILAMGAFIFSLRRRLR